jgi:VanZ family protein
LSVFANDKLVLQKTDYSLSRLSGLRTQALLVLGNSPTGDSPWKGDLLGFSIRQDTERTQNPQSNAMTFAHTKKESGAFLQTGGKVPLEFFIPSTYRPVKKTILLPPWKEPNYNHSFWKDVFVNILGFIPFGFFFYAWLRESSTEKNFSTILRVVLLGAGISLAIELLQVFLPTRDSSLTDVINNILGTFVGIWLFRKVYGIIFA